MLSNMESKPTAAEASTALTDAEASRAALAGGIATPSWFFTSIAAAIAVQIGTTAVGLGGGAMWALVAGWAGFAAVAGVQLARFRRLNGVWLGGFASRVVFGTGMAASLSYVAALGGAIWAGYGSHWWLVGLLALAGGAAYALSGRRWMRTYRAAPAVHGRGESAAWLAAIGLTAVAGVALLLINS
jgi:hypothetical protein